MSIYGNLFNRTEQSLDFSLESYQLLFDNFMNECTLYDSLMIESSIISIDEAFSTEAIKKKFNDMIEAIKKFLKNIYEFIKGVINKIKGKFTKKTYDNIDKQTEEIKKEMKEKDIKPEDIKIEPGKTADQYEAEIEKIKEEIENLKGEEGDNKQQDSQSSSNNDRYRTLAMKRNEMQVLKIQKAISTILDNDLLYFNPHILIGNYVIDLSGYKSTITACLTDLKDFDRFLDSSNETGKEGTYFLANLVHKDVLALDDRISKDGTKYNNGFKFSTIDLEKYIKDEMKKRKETSKIKNLKSFFDNNDWTLEYPLVKLESLLLQIQDIVELFISKFNSITGFEFDNIEKDSKSNEYKQVDYYKNEIVKLNDKYIDTFNKLKSYIEQLKTASTVLAVAIKYEGQRVGAYKSAVSALKALI